MPIKNVASISVYVNDEDKALDFYTNKLGFEKHDDQPMGEGLRWISVNPPGSDTEIILVRGYAEWSPEKVGKFSGVVFRAENIQETFQQLSARGVKFTEEPAMQYYGMWQAQFEDQDGNGYVLVEQPKANDEPTA